MLQRMSLQYPKCWNACLQPCKIVSPSQLGCFPDRRPSHPVSGPWSSPFGSRTTTIEIPTVAQGFHADIGVSGGSARHAYVTRFLHSPSSCQIRQRPGHQRNDDAARLVSPRPGHPPGTTPRLTRFLWKNSQETTFYNPYINTCFGLSRLNQVGGIFRRFLWKYCN